VNRQRTSPITPLGTPSSASTAAYSSMGPRSNRMIDAMKLSVDA
jgi:hypothetical protein